MRYWFSPLVLLAVGCGGDPDISGTNPWDAIAEERVADEHFTVAVRDAALTWTDADITWQTPQGEVSEFTADAEGVEVLRPDGLVGHRVTNFAEWIQGHPYVGSCASGSGTAVFVRAFGSRRRGFVVRFRHEGERATGCVPVWSSTLPEDVFRAAVSAPAHRYERFEADSVAVSVRPDVVLPQVRVY